MALHKVLDLVFEQFSLYPPGVFPRTLSRSLIGPASFCFVLKRSRTRNNTAPCYYFVYQIVDSRYLGAITQFPLSVILLQVLFISPLGWLKLLVSRSQSKEGACSILTVESLSHPLLERDTTKKPLELPFLLCCPDLPITVFNP